MNKKFLSAILFGALMVTSTGTFVSCKDYDDDIDEINATLTDLKSQIAALQTEVSNGNWVTDLVDVEGGFKVTFNNGKTYTIINGKNGEKGEAGTPGAAGAPGAAGDKLTIDETTGEWKINGEATGWFANKKDQPVKVNMPKIESDGYWYFYNDEAKEYEKSSYKANGAAYAVNADNRYILYIPDADGTIQEIVLPGEGSAIAELELVGYHDDVTANYENGFTPMFEQSVVYNAYKAEETKDWKGNKGNLSGNEILVAYNTKGLVARVAPNNIDASKVTFTLVNSKGVEAPVNVSMSAFSVGNNPLTRTASVNGMYYVDLGAKAVTSSKTAEAWAESIYKAGDKPVLFALQSSENMISKYDIAIIKNTASLSIDQFYIWTPWIKTEVTDATSEEDAKEISLNSTYNVSTNCDEFLYDSYLAFNADQMNQWGIQYDKANAPMDFTVTKLPDSQTPAPIEVTMKYITKAGGAEQKKTFYVIPRTNLDGAVQLCDQINHKLVKAIEGVSENSVVVPMTKMIEALGATGYTTWKNDAKIVTLNTDYTVSISKTDNSGNIEDTYTLLFLDGNKEKTTDKTKAQYVKILFNNAYAIDLSKEYVAKITFKGNAVKYLNGIINTVKIPLKFSIPAISDVLVKEPGVFVDGGNVAHAYLNDFSDYSATADATAKYALSNAFNKFADHIDKAGLKFRVELGKITGTSTNASTVAGVNNGGSASSTAVETFGTNKVDVQLTDKNKGYKKDMDVKFTALKYLGLYSYDDYKFVIRIMSPLKEGKFEAKSGSIKISATGETNVTKADVWAYTYNNEVKYDIFKVAKYDATNKNYVSAWDRTDIASVKFEADNNVFGVVIDEPTDVILEDAVTGEVKRESFITLNGKNLAAGQKAQLTIVVKDKWGYELKLPVDVETTVTTGN